MIEDKTTVNPTRTDDRFTWSNGVFIETDYPRLSHWRVDGGSEIHREKYTDFKLEDCLANQYLYFLRI